MPSRRRCVSVAGASRNRRGGVAYPSRMHRATVAYPSRKEEWGSGLLFGIPEHRDDILAQRFLSCKRGTGRGRDSLPRLPASAGAGIGDSPEVGLPPAPTTPVLSAVERVGVSASSCSRRIERSGVSVNPRPMTSSNFQRPAPACSEHPWQAASRARQPRGCLTRPGAGSAASRNST